MYACLFCHGEVRYSGESECEVMYHRTGCPGIWEQIFREAGDWWNAQRAKDMADGIHELIDVNPKSPDGTTDTIVILGG